MRAAIPTLFAGLAILLVAGRHVGLPLQPNKTHFVGAQHAAPTPAAAVAPATAAALEAVPMLEHPDKVVDYTLHAKLDTTSHTVHGEGTIAWRNISRVPVRELWLHLYLNAFKNQSSAFMRAPTGGFRGNTVPTEWGTIDVQRLTLVDENGRTELGGQIEVKRAGDDDETDARVPLAQPIAPGDTITLEVEWDDKLPSIVERTGYDGSFHMVAQWFPKIAVIEPDGTFAHFPFHHLGEFYADFGRFDVTLDVPEGYVVGATGPLIEAHTSNGRHVERHVQDDVHDFAWTAWDKFESRTEQMGEVSVTALYPKGRGVYAERELGTIRFALPHYRELYGTYPYSVLTLVHPPASAAEAGGMEYPTLITTGDQGMPWTPRGVRTPELTVAHEFGHQYFYGLIASNEDKWPLLDEGLNSYAEAEALEAWKGEGSAIDLFGLEVSDIHGHAERARHFTHDAKIAQPADAFTTGNAYGGLVYNRTAALLETLRRVWGNDVMQRAMGTYARAFRFKHPTPDDLVSTFRTTMGEHGDRAAEILHAALFDKGWVDFVITDISSYPAHGPWGIFDVNGKREVVAKRVNDGAPSHRSSGWVLVTRRGTLSFPVDIEFVADDGTRTRVPWDGKDESIRVSYNGNSPLHAAIVDPDNRILLDENPENNFATARGKTKAGAPRTLERATYYSELVMGVLSF
ncbi:MAG: M1 family metallopeptidase [Polyangiaceae bacterium]|nr:M1 family metallopeptidase [Polyangiaceae bacterium]